MQCKNCGAVNRQGAKFCNQCGARMVISHPAPSVERTIVSQPTPQVQAPKSRLVRIVSDLKWIIVIYVFLFLCCGASAFFLGFRTNWILWKLGLR